MTWNLASIYVVLEEPTASIFRIENKMRAAVSFAIY
jgi:hypothetical protein